MTSTTPTPLPTHPRTGLRALGVLPSGRIVWPVLGGDPTGTGGDGQGGTAGGQQQGAGDGQGSGQQQGQGQQTPGGQQGGQQQGGQAPPLGPDGQPWDPARAQALIDNLRAENTRLKGKQPGGQQDGQGQAPGQQQPPAGQAPATDDGTTAQLRDQAAQIAVFKVAARHSGDAAALTDSMSFMAKVRALDHTADDHQTKVADLLKEHLKDNPHHRVGQAHRGGSDGTGRPGVDSEPVGLGAALRDYYAKK